MSFRPLKRFSIALTSILVAAAVPATASAAVEFSSDAERPWNEEWASSSCASGDRISRVATPSAQGERAYRIELRDGDDSWGERCELGQGNPGRSGFPTHHEGQERWISYQVRLPDAYPVETNDWNNIFQLKGAGYGGPPVNMAVEDGQFILKNSPLNSSTCCERELWSGGALRNRWVRFTLHVKFSPDPGVGFLELYGDLDGTGQKLLMPKKHIWTMRRDSSGRAIPSHSRIGLYRNARISGNAHAFFDGYTVATDRASAERRAFGSSTPVPPSPAPKPPEVDLPGDAKSASRPTTPTSSLRLNGRPSVRVRRFSSTRSTWNVGLSGDYRDGRRVSPFVRIQMRHAGRWVELTSTRLHSDGGFRASARMRLGSHRRDVVVRPVIRSGISWRNAIRVRGKAIRIAR